MPSKAKTQPLTVEIMDVLHEHCVRMQRITGHDDSKDAVICNCAVLASHTGSRVSEYAQSKSLCKKERTPFLTVPKNAASGGFGGYPLAFVREDFTFLRENHILS